DEEARPERLEREGFLRVDDRRAAPLERILLAHHLHVDAHRDGREAVFGLGAAPAPPHRPEPDLEAIDTHARPAGGEEVPDLADQDEDAEHDDEHADAIGQEHDDGPEPVGQGDEEAHERRPPWRASMALWTARRVSASTATHASIEPSSPAREALS